MSRTQYRRRIRKGFETEYRVLVALKAMYKQGKIDRYKYVKRLSEDDLNGIDFWVLCRRRWVPLQIKSSEYGKMRHDREYPHIPCIIGTADNLIPRLKRAIRAYVRGDYA